MGYQKASDFMGKLMIRIGKILPFYKKICNNLRLSSLKIPDDKIDVIATQVLDNFGRYIAEFQFIHSWDKKELEKNVIIEGKEYLENVNKKPTLMLTPHMANWEVLVRYFYFRENKVLIINRSMNNTYVNKLLFEYRSKCPNFDYVDKNHASKKIIEAASKNILIGMLADVKLQGEQIDFLGRKAESSTIVARLHLKYKMEIIPVKLERLQHCKFKITFLPPIKFNQLDVKNSDLKAMTMDIHKVYENMIAENPGQWFWLHNRWKLKAVSV